MVNLPFFFDFLSLSLSPPEAWNMDDEPAVDFFFDLADFVSSSLSSLSDLAAAQVTGVTVFKVSFHKYVRGYSSQALL